jgi:hypothetical protein
MSIRTYTDSAIAQGKLAAEQANQFVGSLAGRAAGAVGELRTHAERALPIDTIKSAVEPYVGRTRDQIQKQYQTVSSDRRVAKAVATAETVAGAVTDTVQERVVKPVAGFTGLGGNRTSKPAATAARKPAATRPATKPATKKAAAKPAAKKSTSTGTTASKRTTTGTDSTSTS